MKSIKNSGDLEKGRMMDEIINFMNNVTDIMVCSEQPVLEKRKFYFLSSEKYEKATIYSQMNIINLCQLYSVRVDFVELQNLKAINLRLKHEQKSFSWAPPLVKRYKMYYRISQHNSQTFYIIYFLNSSRF